MAVWPENNIQSLPPYSTGESDHKPIGVEGRGPYVPVEEVSKKLAPGLKLPHRRRFCSPHSPRPQAQSFSLLTFVSKSSHLSKRHRQKAGVTLDGSPLVTPKSIRHRLLLTLCPRREYCISYLPHLYSSRSHRLPPTAASTPAPSNLFSTEEPGVVKRSSRRSPTENT